MSQNWIKSQLLAGFGLNSNLYDLSKSNDKHVFTIERHVRIFRITAPVYITIHVVGQREFYLNNSVLSSRTTYLNVLFLCLF